MLSIHTRTGDNMNRLNIYQNVHKEQTAVSNYFIDEFMADANDAQLKIYLFLIRMMSAGLPTSVTDIADKFNYTEKDVLRALMYWESRQLLSLEYDAAHNLSGIQVLSLDNPYEVHQPAPRITPVLSFIRPASMQSGMTAHRPVLAGAAAPVPNPMSAQMSAASSAISTQPMMQASLAGTGSMVGTASITEYPVQEMKAEPEKPSYTMDDLKNFKSNEEAQQLLFAAEQYIGRQLTRSDMETILFLYDRLGFSADLIDYLIQHCVERGKKDFRYMEKVALSWAEQGITTPKQAGLASKKYDKTVYTIMKSLGKNTAPAPKELEYINKWTNEYGFLLDVIQEACDKTVMTTDSHRFAYADGILSKWYRAGVHHKSDIAALDASYQRPVKQTQNTGNNTSNKFNRFAQNTYDFDQLEQNILSN